MRDIAPEPNDKMIRKFDVVVIGTGSAASAAATGCRKAGRQVAVVDSRPFGGTCALRGCDPKKVNAVLEFKAQSDAEFVLGSAVPHNYDLILGSHSVHSTTEALHRAEARISEIQMRLVQEGKV